MQMCKRDRLASFLLTVGLSAVGITAGTTLASPLQSTLLQKAELTSALLLGQLALAMVMVVVCAMVHVLLTALIIRAYHSDQLRRWMIRSTLRQVTVIALAALATFVAMALEILAWTLLYLRLGALSSLEKALYFSSVAFTSLGYGDVTLQAPYRILGSLEALVGILMAGWSTALLVAVSQKVIVMRKDARPPQAPRSEPSHGDGGLSS